MNIEITKYELLNQLMNTNDESLLKQLVSVFKKAGATSKPVSIEQYNRELDAAEARIKSGKYTSHEDVETESETW